MISRNMLINFRAFDRAADAFNQVATQAPQALVDVVTATTDPTACGATRGLGNVDAAVGIMLQVFGELMTSTIVPGLDNGLAGEAALLADSETLLRETEDNNTDLAASIGDVL